MSVQQEQITFTFRSKVVDENGVETIQEDGTLDVPKDFLITHSNHFKTMNEDVGDIHDVLMPNVRKEFFSFAQDYYNAVPEEPFPVKKENETQEKFDERVEEYKKKDTHPVVDKENEWIKTHLLRINENLPAYHKGLEPFVEERIRIRRDWLNIARERISEIQAWWREHVATQQKAIVDKHVVLRKSIRENYKSKIENMPNETEEDKKKLEEEDDERARQDVDVTWERNEGIKQLQSQTKSKSHILKAWIHHRSLMRKKDPKPNTDPKPESNSESKPNPNPEPNDKEIALQNRERRNEYLRKCEEFRHRPIDDYMCDCADPLEFLQLLHSLAKLNAVAIQGMEDDEWKVYAGEKGLFEPLTDEEMQGFDDLLVDDIVFAPDLDYE